MRCFQELKSAGALAHLKLEYGSYVEATPESGFDFSLRIPMRDLQNEEVGKLIQKLSLLKRNCMAAPFESAFSAQEKNQPGSLTQISYREGESIWITPHSDRVTVIFSVLFKDSSDIIYGKVFLQVAPFLLARNLLMPVSS